jgi:UDP-glucose 4-epimerase
MNHSSKCDIRGKSVLVTGGAGFIGSHLVSRLVEGGATRVIVLDSLRYGDPANLSTLSDAVQLVPFTLGTDSSQKLKEVLQGIDYVFHLAAEKHNQSKETPYQVIRANIDGSLALFESAAAAGVKKLVYTSSLYAYGRMDSPRFEELEVPHPKTIYGISKLAGEYLCDYIGQQSGLACNVLRYLFIYGPKQFAGMGYKSVIVKNFERIINGESPIVYGDGLQTLDYVFVDDAVDATLLALNDGCKGEVFNVATGNGVTVKQLIETMLRVADSDLKISYAEADWTAGTVRVGSGQKAAKMLGWQPKVSLEDGLRRTYNWMKGLRKS